MPVMADVSFCGALVQHEEAGWVCLVNCCRDRQGQCKALCRCYCEWLMRDCPVLGMGCRERYPVPLAVMRDRIAHAVAAELC